MDQHPLASSEPKACTECHTTKIPLAREALQTHGYQLLIYIFSIS